MFNLTKKFNPKQFTEGSIIFAGSASLAQDNSNLFWNNTTKSLLTNKGRFSNYIDVVEISTPSNPPSNEGRIYCKDVGGITKLYFLDSSGTDTDLLAGGGGGGEANTASNQGSGISIYYQKSGVDLQFNAIKSENDRLSVSLDGVTHDVELTLTEANIVHQNLSGAGTNSHSQIDTHIADGTLHFLEGAIDHTAILNIGSNSHTQIDTHIALVNEHLDWEQASVGTIDPTNYADNDTTDHTLFSNIGTNTHAQIDTHIADSTIHFTVASIDHTAILNIGTNSHADIDSHISSSNPHSISVGATNPFGTDNVLLRSDLTGRLAQATGISVDDSENISGVAGIGFTGTGTAGTSTIYRSSSGVFVIKVSGDGSAYDFQLVSRSGNALISNSANTTNLLIGAGNGSLTFNSNDFIVDTVNGIDLNDSSSGDVDYDIITVAVTDNPKFWWDESEDTFSFTKGITTTALKLTNPLDEIYGGTGLSTIAIGSILYTNASDTLTALTGVAGDDGEFLRFNWNGGSPTLSWEAGGGGGGEANTMSSQGSGTSLYYQKSGVDLQLNAIKSENDRLSVALDGVTHDVELTLNEGNIVHQNLSGAGTSDHSAIDTHLGSSSNPHTVTKAQVGLTNVPDVDCTDADNISDGVTNAIITLTQETNFESAYTHSGLTSGNPHSVSKSDVSLGNVVNLDTSDADNISDGVTNAIITLTQETNFESAFSHISDNDQAHTDYLKNNAGDTMQASVAGALLTLDNTEDTAERPSLVIRGGGTTYEHHIQFNSADNLSSTILDKTQLDALITNSHAESHSIVSHSDTTATGAELDELTDGSETTLHTHAGGGGGNVSATSTFGNDNRLIRSDGVDRNVQASGIIIDDSDNVSGINKLNVTVDCLLDPTVADGASAVVYTFDSANTLSTTGARLASFRNNSMEHLAIDDIGGIWIGQDFVDVWGNPSDGYILLGVRNVTDGDPNYVGFAWVVTDDDAWTNYSQFDVWGGDSGTGQYATLDMRADENATGDAKFIINLKASDLAKLQLLGNTQKGMVAEPSVADGASAVAYKFQTSKSLTTSGAKIFDILNNTTPVGYIDKDGSMCIGTQSARSDFDYGCKYGFRGDKHTADLTNGDDFGLFVGFVDGASWNEYAMVNSYVKYGTTQHDLQFELDAQQVGVSASGLLFKGRSSTTATNSFSQFEMYSTGSLYFRMNRSGTKVNFEPTVADGASSIAYKFDTLNDLATAGAKIVSVQHQAVEKFYIAKDRSAIIGDGDITGTNVLGTTWADYNTNWLSYFGGTASNLDDITVVRGSKADYYGLMLLSDGGSGAGVHVWDDAQAYPFFIFTGWNTGHIIYYGGGSWGDCWDAEEHRWYVDPDGVSINSGVLVMQLNASGLSLQYNQTIDHTHAEALLVRRNGDTGDVFIVDTTNGKVTIDAIDDSAEKPALVIMGGGTTYEHHIQFNSADNATNTTLDKTQLDSIINHVGASNPHSGSAGSGANSDITSLTGLTTPLDEIYGGTGQSTIAVGDLLYGSASNVLSKLTKGSKGQVLRMDDSGTNVEWDTPLKSKSITIENPTSSEDISMFFTNKAITITEIRAVVIGTTPSVTWTIRHNATDRSAVGNEVVTSGTTTTSTTSGSDVTSFNDATIPADSFVWMETTAQTGTVTELHITIIYRETTT
jgi:hypothetical protein